MEEEYNWSLILKIAIPVALVEAYIFYTNIADGWKWFSMVAALLSAGIAVYIKNKKKSNIFTAVAIVFLVVLIVRFLKNFGAILMASFILIGIVLSFALLIVLFLINFYRDPEREIPKGKNIVAPADGKIISILEINTKNVDIEKGIFGRIKTLTGDVANECYVISIFMSPFDVHINRAPIQGIVKSIKYTQGKFFGAYNLEKSLQNEKNEIIIENKKLKIKVIQIAGYLARRIKCYARNNQKVNKGEKIGMIALSSQTTIIIPRGVELKVKINDKVKSGESILADLR